MSTGGPSLARWGGTHPPDEAVGGGAAVAAVGEHPQATGQLRGGRSRRLVRSEGGRHRDGGGIRAGRRVDDGDTCPPALIVGIFPVSSRYSSTASE